MRKLIGKTPAILAMLVMIGTVFIWGGCTSVKAEGLAIYLTREDISPDKMATQSHINIADSPVIAMNDILAYNAQTYEFTLTDKAFERISQLEVPVRGKSFVVCVDRKILYWGAFWTPISSLSFNGVTIWKPLSLKEPYIITLTLGYPSPAFYGGEDPRNNPEAIKSLEQAGKLITRLSVNTIDKLPRSAKGYELYSWPAGSQWQFTLITGTNRNKAPAEIVAGEDVVSEAGWIKIQVAGTEAIRTVLGKLQPGESIFWLSAPRSEQSLAEEIRFSLPPAADIEAIREQAVKYGLDLHVAADQGG
jgi:hypothetical protein